MTTTRRPRRGRPKAAEGERKDRLVQTRVPEDLDETLREEARRRRTTVSQLVRNVLESTFQLVDDIVAGAANLTETVTRDAKRIAAAAKGQPKSASTPEYFGGVYAWQEVVLN